MILASCQNAVEDTGPTETAPTPSDYPSLHTVPPRPQLTYTVEQRRAIVEGLIADRENARYSNQVVRYRAGLSGLPPPDTPPAAAAPLSPPPDVSDASGASLPPDPARGRPVAAPETQFDYHDDDLDTFLEGMAGEGRPGGSAPGPESNAAPAGRSILRSGAARPVDPPAASYDGPAPAGVWATPAKRAGFPTTASATGTRGAASAPVGDERSLAGRAPGVVWGMVDLPEGSAGRTAAAREAEVADASRSTASSPASVPTTAAPAGRRDGPGQHLPSTETAIAGRAPGVVWGMVEMPDRPAAAASGVAAPVADVRPASPTASSPANGPAPAAPVETDQRIEIAAGEEKGGEPAATAMAERPGVRPPSSANAAGIDISGGLIVISLAASADPAGPPDTIDFAPGSATLAADAATRLERFLAAAKAPDVRIRVVGEADTPALALDRALAVGLALVRGGVPADRLELTLASDAAGDQVRLSAVASEP